DCFLLTLARHRERGEHGRKDRQAEHEEAGSVELSRLAAGIEPEPRRRLDGRDRRAAERLREGARDLAGAAANQLGGVAVGGVDEHLRLDRPMAADLALE